jgi:hypothetical protein
MLTHAFIIAMIVLFIHASSWDGMIFEGIKKIIKPEGHLYKPIYGCPICMTPVVFPVIMGGLAAHYRHSGRHECTIGTAD